MRASQSLELRATLRLPFSSIADKIGAKKKAAVRVRRRARSFEFWRYILLAVMASQSKKRGPYRRYLTDPTVPIPRQTLYNWRCTDGSTPPTSETIQLEASRMDVDQDCHTDIVDEVAGEETYENDSTSSESESDRDEAEDSGDLESAWEQMEEGGAEQQMGGSERLYPGARISEDTGILLLTSLASKHRLTHVALADILSVIAMHLPEGIETPKSYRY